MKSAMIFCLVLVPAAASANEMRLDDAMRRDMTTAIHDAGYNCPNGVRKAWAWGRDHYGTVTRVACSGVAFRVTFRPDGRVLIAPWK